MGGVNWQDLGVSSTTGINWAGINTLMTTMQTVFTRVGQEGDGNPHSLFGQLDGILVAVKKINPGADISTILSTVTNIQSALGTNGDTSSSTTVFGNIKSVTKLLGAATDTSTTTLFGITNTASSNAAAAQSYAQQIITDLGVNGATPNVYAKLKNLEESVQNIQDSATQLVNGSQNAPTLTQETIDALVKFLNDQAKKAGLAPTMSVEQLSVKESKDMEKVNDKLEEIAAKIAALREAMKVQDVVVKSYYESE